MVLLTFNIINNKPETTSGSLLSEMELTEITIRNTEAILRDLTTHDVRCTFFVDIPLVKSLEALLKKIDMKGHEIALYNSGLGESEVVEARNFIERIIEKQIRGIRRKKPVLSIEQLKSLGFIYVSDIENAGILFPFKRLQKSTEIAEELGVSIIPESVSPYSHIPYNDFVFQVTPLEYYKSMATESLKNDEFIMVYLNSWQLTDFKKYRIKVPFYRSYNSGKKMEDKVEQFLSWINEHHLATSRIKDYIF